MASTCAAAETRVDSGGAVGAKGAVTAVESPAVAMLVSCARARPPSNRSYRFFCFLAGTLAPFSRASLRPMAMACFRLVTFAPELLLSVPVFRRCIADFTVFAADLPYFAMLSSCALRAR